MTKFQKQMLTIAAAGALTAVTALPAMAFENEFHGIYNFNTVFSNFNTGASGNFSPNNLPDKAKMNNYMEQRARLQYTAKASDDLKLVTHFEINNRFGASNTLTGSVTTAVDNAGSDLDTDGLNIVTKHVYLDFNVGKSFNTKLGLQPYKDTLKGIFIDADVPAVMTSTKMGAYTLGLGFARYNDAVGTGGITRLGDRDTDLFIMDNTFAFSKDTKATFSYYFNADYVSNNAKLIHTFGLGGETKLAGINLSGFAAMQAGHQKLTGPNSTSTQYHGWAANVAANMNVGPGKAKTAFLFTSGNNHNSDTAHNNGWTPVTNAASTVTTVNSYNEGGMMILVRNTGNSPTSTDQYVRRNITNVALLSLGYDAKLTEKFNLDTNVGFAWAPASFGAPGDKKLVGTPSNNSDFMGTEINMTAGYQLYKNLKVMALAGYMINGGYYKNSAANNTDSPENPYTMRLQARYSF